MINPVNTSTQVSKPSTAHQLDYLSDYQRNGWKINPSELEDYKSDEESVTESSSSEEEETEQRYVFCKDDLPFKADYFVYRYPVANPVLLYNLLKPLLILQNSFKIIPRKKLQMLERDYWAENDPRFNLPDFGYPLLPFPYEKS